MGTHLFLPNAISSRTWPARQSPNEQWQRTVTQHRVRAAGARRHCAPAPRMARFWAAAELHVRLPI